MNHASTEQRYLRLISGETRGPLAGAARAALATLEPLFRAVVACRNAAYDHGIAPVRQLPRPVICVGNLTTGGTGKTPMVAWVVQRLLAIGLRPAVLTRGYRRPGDAESDEAALLRQALGPEPPVIVGADRYAAASEALRAGARIDVFVMDDGYQHRRLHRDLNLLLIDATRPSGFDRLLPRGLLREPLNAGLRRAHAVILTRCDLVDPATLEAIERRIRATLAGDVPVARTAMAIDGVDLEGARRPLADLQTRRCFLFAGVGNPDSFEGLLRSAGLVVAGRRWFADHHAYDATDIARLRHDATDAGADLLVTTAKDAVKLRRLAPDAAVVQVSPRFLDADSQRAILQLLLQATSR